MARLKGVARAAYVHAMFERIAPHYDFVNRVMTGGRDRVWRQLAVREAGLRPGDRLLDLATGTGDMALEAVRQAPGACVVGADFTLKMMQRARAKPGAASVRWTGADALHLPFPDESFDAILSGFMARNVIDVAGAFAEQYRVVRPGGRVVCLEIARTPTAFIKPAFRLYFYGLIPILGGLLSGQPEAYTYLPDSLNEFLTPDELADVMRAAGLQQVRYRPLMMGTVTIHVGVKGK